MSALYDYPVVVEIPVAWGDMDAMKHVNNVQFFRYFETARIRYFEELRIVEYIDNYAKGMVLGSTSAKYLAPVKYPDTLSVGVRTRSVDGSRIAHEYAVWSHESSQLVAKGESLSVFFDAKQHRPCDLPQALLEDLFKLEPNLKQTENS